MVRESHHDDYRGCLVEFTDMTTQSLAAKKKPPRAGMGRPKGSANKVQADVKAMILGALEQAGGQQYLAEQAEANPAAFMSLVGKVLPKDVRAEVSGAIELVLAEKLKQARERIG
jgi:hypothetical protein